MDDEQFKEVVWDYYRNHSRTMPWRDDPTFYNVLVSELMLQQTQVTRVLVKYRQFMDAFPTIEALARVPLADVIIAWKGLGYNRRAKYLHQAAQYVIAHGVPQNQTDLTKLPGVGKNTAGAIMAYVYNQPVAYIETNIRTVYFHHYFSSAVAVSDRQLLEVVEATLDHEHPREWYWALMDYGTYLKSLGLARLDISRHYKKQSALKGSLREVRGQIVRQLTQGDCTVSQLKEAVVADGRFEPALNGLLRDGLVTVKGEKVHLTK